MELWSSVELMERRPEHSLVAEGVKGRPGSVSSVKCLPEAAGLEGVGGALLLALGLWSPRTESIGQPQADIPELSPV